MTVWKPNPRISAIKPRARYTPRLKSWAFWIPPNGWPLRMVGFGSTLEEAFEDWKKHLAQAEQELFIDLMKGWIKPC